MTDCYRSRRNLDVANGPPEVVDRFHQLSLQFPGVRAASQIATALAVRELVFVAIFVDIVHFSAVSACIYKTRTKKISGRRESIIIVAIPRTHRPIRDDYCRDAEYCEQQQLADFVLHGDHPCSSTLFDAWMPVPRSLG
jgi:hypothetical protein